MKSYAILLFLPLALLVLPVRSQTPRADSLRQVLRTGSLPDPIRMRCLLALAQELIISDAPQATHLSQQALGLAQRLADPVGEGQALLGLSILFRRQSSYKLARRYAQQAKRLFSRLGDRRGLGKAWQQISAIDMVQGNPVPALAAALKGLALAEATGDLQTRSRLLAAIGTIYFTMGSYEQALPMLQAALIAGQRAGDQLLVLSSLNGLGNSFQKLKKWPQALVYYQRALQLSRQLGDGQGETGNETNLAEVYGMQGNRAEALAHGLKARQLVMASHDSYSLPSVELMLARAYLLAHQTDSALVLAHHGLTLSQHTRSNDNIRTASDILAQAYAERSDFNEAYRYRTLYMAYNDTLSGEDTRRQTSTLRYDYELDKKQAQIALLTKTRQLREQEAAHRETIHRQQFYALLAGLLGAGVVAGLLGRNGYLKQRANRDLNEKNVHIAQQRDDLDRTLTALQAAQHQLVQSEKLVAMAALTAGVAHEIQNPLNFVNNFSEVSLELVTELEEAQQARDAAKGVELLGDLKQNLHKIHQHGARAEGIIRSMLAHARPTTGQRQPVDLNALATDYLRLAYHSLLAKHRDFVVAHPLALDPGVGRLQGGAQELGRVLLNLFNNAFYAVHQKAAALGPAYAPEVRVCTRCVGPTRVELRVRDNGMGVPAAVVEKIFEPFFTTKPAGEGTGLGLSLSYDIVTKSYGGTLTVETEEGEYTELVMTLPRTPGLLQTQASS